MFPAERLDRERATAVRVAFAQHRVDGTARDPGEALQELLIGVALRVFRVFRNVVAVRPELLDRLLDLGYRGRDVGQLDDDGLGILCQLAQEGQIIRDLLLPGEVVGETGDDAARERDVARFDLDTRAFEEGANDRQERIAGQRRGFVGLSPLNRRGFSFHGFSVSQPLEES